MNAYEALCRRKSVRKYKQEVIPQNVFRHILRFRDEIEPLYPEIPVQWQIVNAIEGKCPIKGAFMVDAPYYLVLHSQEQPGAALNVGYMMEQMVIFLTMRGIGTCYQGGPKAPELCGGMKPMMILAFGYAAEELYREPAKAKRKPMAELCTWKETGDETAQKIMKAAVLSPSGINRQPWRFVYSKGTIHVFAKKLGVLERYLSHMQEVDCGIAMANIALAAEDLWVDTSWSVAENLREKEFANLEYVASLTIKDM